MHVTPVTDAMSRLCSWAWPSARCCALPACARLPFTHPESRMSVLPLGRSQNRGAEK